jgi:cell division GTPase FtsZ
MESAKIKVVGVGGGGNNAVNRMIGSGLHVGFRLHFLGLGQNSDIPTLSLSPLFWF